jgi:hypothetical protein
VALGRDADEDLIVFGSDLSVWGLDAVTGAEFLVQGTADTVTIVALAGDLLAFATGTTILTATVR